MTLEWEIKRSLVEYVEREGGSVTLSDDAERIEPGFAFAHSPGPPKSRTFRGTVTFEAYGGLLDITIANPRISDDDALLSVEDSAGFRFPFCDLTPRASQTWETRLRVEGTNMFGGTYPPGTSFATLYVRGH